MYKLHILTTLLVIIGALNWGLYAFNYNLVAYISFWINSLFNTNYSIDKVIYILVALAAISLAICKYTWLPFLGQTVFPKGLLELKSPSKYDKIVPVRTKPNSIIVYWASTNKNDPNAPVDIAYGDLTNSGVTKSDNNGNASFNIIEGNSYIVPWKGKLNKHVHYRIFDDKFILGPVQTVFY